VKIRSLFKRALIVVLALNSFNCALAIDPVNPNATPEAKALLNLFYAISITIFFRSLFGSIIQNVYFCTPIVQVGSKRGNVGFPPSGPK
jgi:hypothetical protein